MAYDRRITPLKAFAMFASVDLERAAELLNVSAEYLLALRNTGDVYAYPVMPSRYSVASLIRCDKRRQADRQVALDELVSYTERIGGYGKYTPTPIDAFGLDDD